MQASPSARSSHSADVCVAVLTKERVLSVGRRCDVRQRIDLVGNRSRQPVVESNPVSGPNAALPSTSWKLSQSSFFFGLLPAEASEGKSEKSRLCPSLVYQLSRMPENKITLANSVEMVRCRAVGCVSEMKVDRNCCKSDIR
jgi:hypothetical protein